MWIRLRTMDGAHLTRVESVSVHLSSLLAASLSCTKLKLAAISGSQEEGGRTATSCYWKDTGLCHSNTLLSARQEEKITPYVWKVSA